MELTNFSFKLILIFLPGVISFLIIEALTYQKDIKLSKSIIYSLILGFLLYSIYYLLTKISYFGLKFSLLNNLSNESINLDFNEIIIVTLLSVPIGYLITFFLNRKIMHSIAHRLNISNKFSDLDVWSHIMNSKSVSSWVYVRDYEFNRAYYGSIRFFSDSIDKDELFLLNVTVYDLETSKELYETPSVYLSRDRNKILMEFAEIKK